MIPPRAIAEGAIDAFGAIDPNEGGQTQRQMIVGKLSVKPSARESFELTLYLVRFEMRLYNDFTDDLTATSSSRATTVSTPACRPDGAGRITGAD